jgi:hypothetical protein
MSSSLNLSPTTLNSYSAILLKPLKHSGKCKHRHTNSGKCKHRHTNTDTIRSAHTEYLCISYISEQTAIISLHSTAWLLLMKEMRLLCEVRIKRIY